MVFGVITLLFFTVKAAFRTFTLGFVPEMNEKLGEIAPSMLEFDGDGKLPIMMIIEMSIIGMIVGVHSHSRQLHYLV